MDEEEEDVTSSTADLLEEGEELLGSAHVHKHPHQCPAFCQMIRRSVVDCVSDEDSGNEGEERRESSGTPDEMTSCETNIRDEDEEQRCSETDEQPAEEENAAEEEDQSEISFPDTSISLSHLQPNR